MRSRPTPTLPCLAGASERRRGPSPRHSALTFMAWSAALLLGACHSQEDTDSGPDTTPDTGAEFFQGVEVELAEKIPTVATVRWQTREAARCSVSFSEAGQEPTVTPVEESATTEHEVVLVGMRQQRDVQTSLWAEAGSKTYTSELAAFTTGQLPVSLQDFTLSANDTARSAGGLTLVPITASFGGSCSTWLTVLDQEGELLWSYSTGPAPRMRLSPDGSGVTYLTEVADGSDERHALLARVSWTGDLLWSHDVSYGQRDFAIMDNGDLAVLVQATREVDGYPEPLVGDQIHVVTTDGVERTIWDGFENFPPGWCGIEPIMTDWTHANYLTWSAEAGELLVVLRGPGAVVAVDPEDGEQRWVLSNTCGAYVSADGTPLLVNPHAVEPIPGGFLVFNQNEEPNGCSGAYEVAVDSGAGTASTTWSYPDPDCTHIYFMGNAQPLDNGNRLIGMNGQVSEVTPEGVVVHQLLNPIDQTFAYAERVQSLYPAAGAR